MSRYRNRSLGLVVDAIQYTGQNAPEVAAFVGRDELEQHCVVGGALSVPTAEGPRWLHRGSWLVRGDGDEQALLCGHPVFELIYEAVE